MHILVLHEYYLRPEDPGGSRFNEMCAHWRRAGHQVTVLAGQVPYQTGRKPDEYRGWPVVESWDEGVRVLRVYTAEHGRRSTLRRMASMASYAAAASTAVVGLVRDADVVVASSPSLLVVVPGLIAALAGRPMVLEVRDLWPESAVTTGVLAPRARLTRVLYGLERLGYEAADRIVALTPGIAADIVARGLAPSERLAVLPNGVDVEAVPARDELQRARTRRGLGWEGRFVVIYAGAHGIANDLVQYVDAAEALRGRDEVLLVSVGGGAQRDALIAETGRRGLSNLVWMPPVPRAQTFELLHAADAGVAVLQRNPTFHTVYPNKVFDYMAAGLPVICGVDGDARALVEGGDGEQPAGLFAEPGRPDDLARQILWLAEHRREGEAMGRVGRRLVAERFDRRAIAADYLDLLGKVVAEQV